MNEFETRYRVQLAVENWLNTFMNQNGLPASMMVDAVNSVLVQLKDKATQEFIASVSAPSEPSENIQEEKEKEE
uniref:Uncharacterized protein n=1 Tax=Siphoviridae sp. ctZHD14 TaxID=2827891 RepID=A0A8S5SW59_9CAUD|nr:MAG TPA: hypothetical protein [Siphoviridae sp. ctZHD14]